MYYVSWLNVEQRRRDSCVLRVKGDQEASFTKEQMHAGKHQEYEKKLHDCLLAKLAAAQQAAAIAAAQPPVVVVQTQATTDTTASTTTTTTNAKTNGKAKETTIGKDKEKEAGSWPHLDKDNTKAEVVKKSTDANCKEKPEKSKRNKKSNVTENNSKNKTRNEETTCSKDKDKEKETKVQLLEKDKEKTKENSVEIKENKVKKDVLHDEIVVNNNTITSNAKTNKTDEGSGDKQRSKLPQSQPKRSPMQNGDDTIKMPLHDDNSSFFTSNSFSCAKLENEDDDDSSLLNRQIDGQDLLLDINDGDAWDFDFGYTNHSHHLEELATQRCRQQETIKDPLESFANGFGGLDTFSKLDAFMDAPYVANTESLLETLAKNSVNYQMHPQQQVPQQHRQPQQQHYMNGHNGHKDVLLSGLLEQQQAQQQHQQQQQQQQQIQNAFPKLIDMYSRSLHPQQAHPSLMNGLHSQSNGFHNNFAQQQQQHFNHMMVDKRMALLQHRQMEENFLNLSLGKQMQQQQQIPQQQPQQPPFSHSQMNGHFDGFNSFGLGGNAPQANTQKRHVVVDDKDLDFRFQEAQKALEALVESDNHVHNSGKFKFMLI